MNYLAHIYLSGESSGCQLGGFLGDFIKGPVENGMADALGAPWEREVVAGVVLHRRIDAHVDSWFAYTDCIALLGPEYKRWGGVAMDVFFDHWLALNWRHYSDVELPAFSQGFYDQALAQQSRLPPRAAQFIERAAENDLLTGYRDIEWFMPVLERIDQRVRFDTNLLACGEQVLVNYQSLSERFADLMPSLERRANELRLALLRVG